MLALATAAGVLSAYFLKQSVPTLKPGWSTFLQCAALVAFAVGSLQLVEYSFQSFKGQQPGENASKSIVKGAYVVGCYLSGLYIGWTQASG